MDIKEINEKIIELQDIKASFFKKLKIRKEINDLYEKRDLLLINKNQVLNELNKILNEGSLNELNNFLRNHEDYYGKTFIKEYEDFDPTIKEIIYYLYLLKYVKLDLKRKEKIEESLKNAKGDSTLYQLGNKSMLKLTNYLMNKSMELFIEQIKNLDSIDHFALYDIFKDDWLNK